MTARVLVVDDILANIKLLEARLTAEYFEVLTATSGPEALTICAQGLCDIVLLDVMMPGMDGFEVCRRLKGDPQTAHIPVVMVTALDQPSDRLKGLEAGADDFLTKPINELALLARVRSLVRLKSVTDELRARAIASRDLGFGDPLAEAAADNGLGGRILIIDDRDSSSSRMIETLAAQHTVLHEPDPQRALFTATDESPDIAIVSLDLSGFDGLRLCSQMRSLERTRHISVLMLAEADDNGRILRGLDLGVHDYIVRPIDRNELQARVRTQIRRKRYADRLRNNVHASFELAIVDALTGLHNRRYLREVAQRIRISVRAVDLSVRMGGEEFVVVMPDTPAATAEIVAERIRRRIEEAPFAIDQGRDPIPVTVSIGVAVVSGPTEGARGLLKRADEALYIAKSSGRNRVILDQMAA